jgi:hypothetical protein
MNKVFTVRKKRGEIKVIGKKTTFLTGRSWFSHSHQK